DDDAIGVGVSCLRVSSKEANERHRERAGYAKPAFHEFAFQICRNAAGSVFGIGSSITETPEFLNYCRQKQHSGMNTKYFLPRNRRNMRKGEQIGNFPSYAYERELVDFFRFLPIF